MRLATGDELRRELEKRLELYAQHIQPRDQHGLLLLTYPHRQYTSSCSITLPTDSSRRIPGRCRYPSPNRMWPVSLNI